MSRKQPESLKNVPIRKRGKALTIDEKLMVVRVFDKCNEEKRNGNDIAPKDAYSRTSRYTGVGRRQVVEIIRYFRETGEVSKPAQVGNLCYHITNIPSLSEPYIRNFIFNRHLSGQICNATHVQDFLREHLHREIPKRTIRAHLNRMGFTYSRTKKKSRSLHEKLYIRQQRHSYLHNIKTFRQKNYKPIYIDERIDHHYHGNQFSWFNESYGDYLERPTGKGRRWCFISAMSEVSLITETRKIFEAKKSTGDYHDMFNAPHFLEWWVQKFLPNLSPKCVIIMDRATYHLVSDEQIIPQAMRKSELRNWLTNKHIAWIDHG